MRRVVATIEGITPLSQGRFHETEKLPKEAADDYERRTWRNRLHTDKAGMVFIPPMAFKNCVRDAAKYISMGIPGKGKATYTKHFKSGIMVLEGLTLPIHKDDVEGEWLFVPSDGRVGGGKRVKKCFPRIDEWGGDVEFHIVDDVITPEVFEHHLKEAGSFTGIGRFRPSSDSGGFYGRFIVKKFVWA